MKSQSSRTNHSRCCTTATPLCARPALFLLCHFQKTFRRPSEDGHTCWLTWAHLRHTLHQTAVGLMDLSPYATARTLMVSHNSLHFCLKMLPLTLIITTKIKISCWGWRQGFKRRLNLEHFLSLRKQLSGICLHAGRFNLTSLFHQKSNSQVHWIRTQIQCSFLFSHIP